MGVRKINILWGYEDFVDIFGGGTDTTVFGVITKMDWSTVHSSKNPDHWLEEEEEVEEGLALWVISTSDPV